MAFYILSSFSIKSYWFYSFDKNIQDKFRKVNDQLKHYMKDKFRNLQLEEYQSIAHQIMYQLDKTLINK